VSVVDPTQSPGLAGFAMDDGALLNGAIERTTKSPKLRYRPINDDERMDYGDAVSTARGVFNEQGYLEVHSEESGLVATALVDGKVRNTAIGGSKDCELVAVAGAAANVIVECVRTLDKPAREELAFFR